MSVLYIMQLQFYTIFYKMSLKVICFFPFLFQVCNATFRMEIISVPNGKVIMSFVRNHLWLIEYWIKRTMAFDMESACELLIPSLTVII